MTTFTVESSKKLKRMRQLYFVPADLKIFLKNFDKVCETLPDEISTIADAFRHNIKAVIDTISLPFQLASANANNRHWQRFSTAERIRAEILEPEPDETPDEYEKRKRRIATDNARKTMDEFVASEEGIESVSNDIAEFLLAAYDRGALGEASSELVLQCTVLTWSLFEVFA